MYHMWQPILLLRVLIAVTESGVRTGAFVVTGAGVAEAQMFKYIQS